MSDYAEITDIDPPFPLRYECVALSVSLEAMEYLADPDILPGSTEFLERAKAHAPPFHRLSRIRSHSPFHTIDLADVRGMPYMAVVKKPETIVFKNLDSGESSSLTIRRWEGFESVVGAVCGCLDEIKFLTLLKGARYSQLPNPPISRGSHGGNIISYRWADRESSSRYYP